MTRLAVPNPPAVFDADLLSSFYLVYRGPLLIELVPGRRLIPTIVETEISRLRISRFSYVNASLKDDLFHRRFERLELPAVGKVAEEFARLVRKGYGRGEAAAMAWIRFGSDGGTLLSSNLRDVGKYSRSNSLNFMCTEDLLCLAVESGKLAEDQACQVWRNMKKIGRLLPDYGFAESLRRYREHRLI